jgi:hypothetical protein
MNIRHYNVAEFAFGAYIRVCVDHLVKRGEIDFVMLT